MVGRKTERKDGMEPVTALVPPDEKMLIRKAAFLSDRSVSAFVREAAMKAAQRVAKNTLVALDKAA